MKKRTTKKRRATKQEREAGRKNLLAFRAVNPRPAQKHGVHTAIASNGQMLPPGCEDIPEQVDSIIGEMASDLGGDLTAAQKAILASQRLCLVIIELAGRYLRAEGLLDERGKPHPLLAVVACYANALRHNSVVLGVERRARKVGPETLSEYIAERAKNVEAREHTEVVVIPADQVKPQ